VALKARQKLGKYRIERKISEGPIAAVYEALDTIHGLHVALKIPHESSMSEHFLVDFKREARLAHRSSIRTSCRSAMRLSSPIASSSRCRSASAHSRAACAGGCRRSRR
jgi:serine/threonine protein kinase